MAERNVSKVKVASTANSKINNDAPTVFSENDILMLAKLANYVYVDKEKLAESQDIEYMLTNVSDYYQEKEINSSFGLDTDEKKSLIT